MAEIPGVDPFIKARPICAALGNSSRRTLYEWIRAGKFPPPDLPAKKRGEPDLWRVSTVQRALANLGGAPSEDAAA
jgi:hypothetical protein